MSIPEIQKIMGGRGVFHGSWIGGVLFVLGALTYLGQLPLPAFATDIKRVEDKLTRATDKQLAMRLDIKSMQRSLNEFGVYRAKVDGQTATINNRLSAIENSQTAIEGKLDKIVDHLLRTPVERR